MRGRFSGALLAAGFTAIAILAGAAKPATANTYQITFGASDFSPSPTIAPGFVLGQVEVSFDPASDAGTLTTGPAKLDFLNLNVTNLGYFYNGLADVLFIGGTVSAFDFANTMDLGGSADDFELAIGSFSTTPTYLGFYSYTTSDPAHYFISDNSGSVHVAVSATPIPATLPLFVSALGGLGFVGWRKARA